MHCALFENGELQRKVLSALTGNQEDPGDEFARHSSNREKSLRHVTMEAKFLDDNKPKTSLFETSTYYASC